MKIKLGKLEIDPKVILEAYLTKYTATESQKDLAEKRLNICTECPDVEPFLSMEAARCGKCGCLLGGKVFVQVGLGCPVGKWQDVDKEYFTTRAEEIKRSKKLI